MKKRTAGAISLTGLTAAYLILRYPLFFLHGMKDWPFILFIAGTVVIVISGVAFDKKALPVLTLAGYIIGFISGYIFRSDYDIGLNNLWIIWTCVYFGAILAGAAAEIFLGIRNLRQRKKVKGLEKT